MLNSVRKRIGFIFLAFATLVITSVVASYWLIETQKQDALVINLAGRQRMLIQQMTKNALEIEKAQGQISALQPELEQAAQTFDQTLRALTAGGQAPYLPHQPATIPATTNPAVLNTFTQLNRNWTQFRANLETVLQSEPGTSTFDTAIASIEKTSPTLVQQADVAVRLFENESSQKVARLRRVQLLFFFSALALLAVGFWVTQKSIIDPLQTLGAAAERIGQGDLATPVGQTGPDEIGNLARNFESMRARLKTSQEQLEARVAQRTRELSNAFEFSQEIVSELDLERLLSSVTSRAQDLLSAKAASLCLLTADGQQLALQASNGQPADSWGLQQPTAEESVAVQVIGDNQTVVTDTACANCRVLNAYAPGQCVATPLRVGDHTLGALCVVRNGQETFGPEETQALTLLANSAATAITNANLVKAGQHQARETAALTEREKLAADLHDNLAQTLSFLNIESDRLCELIAAGHTANAEAELGQMKLAINTAYGQVRAALVGLREPIIDADDDLAAKLAAAVDDLHQFADIDTSLTIIEPSALALPDITQKQVLHIVKEALNNARRHAQAAHISVRVEREADQARFIIGDDGRGFDPTRIEGNNHLGLTIMRARAERVGGSLEIESAPDAGTTVIARLPLESRSQELEKPTPNSQFLTPERS